MSKAVISTNGEAEVMKKRERKFAKFDERVWSCDPKDVFDVQVLDNSAWLPALVKEVNIFALMERGIIITEEEALTNPLSTPA